MKRDTWFAFQTDNRAVAPVIGVVILFGFAVVALSVYQASVIPNQNADIEFDHNQDVQTDLVDFRNSLINVQRTEATQSTRVRLGVNYPPRLFGLNPPSPSGTLETTQPENEIRIENVELNPNDEFENFDGEAISPSDVTDRLLETDHETRLITYEPRYNEFQNSPTTIYEHSLLYNQFENADLGITDQRLVDGDEINLILVQGDFSQQTSGSVSIDPRRISGPTEGVRIEEDGEPIEVTVPTRTQTEDAWESALEDEPVEIVDSPSPEDETMTLELQDDEYTLRVTALGFSGDQSRERFNIVRQEPLEEPGEGEPNVYDVEWIPGQMEGELVDEDTLEITVEDGEPTATDLVVDVTGERNQPVEDVAVDFGIDTDSNMELNSPESFSYTNAEGRATDTNGLIGLDDADDGDEGRLYAAAGDSVRSLLVRVLKPDEGEEPQIATRIDDLSTVDTDRIRLLTSFDVSNVDEEDFEAVRIEKLRQDGSSIGSDEIANTRGSVELESDFGVGDEIDIQIEVIYTDEAGDEYVEETRVETVTTDGQNTIEEDLSTGESPAFDDVTILDESDPNPLFRIDYVVDQPEGFEVDGALVGLESGAGYDRAQNADQDGEIELSTYGGGNEFKIAGLLREENTGVVVDAGIETRTADGGSQDSMFNSLEAEANRGNIQDVDVTFDITEEADVEIEIQPGSTERFQNVVPNQEQTETVDVTGNSRPVDVVVSLLDSDTDEQIVQCEGTLSDNEDFLTIDPGPGDSEFTCE